MFQSLFRSVLSVLRENPYLALLVGLVSVVVWVVPQLVALLPR